MNFVSRLLMSFLIIVLSFVAITVYADDLPEVRLKSLRRIFHNGEHNAFTDMCRFKGRYYIAFRSCPEGHSVYPSSSIIIISSKDGKEWEQVHQFNVLMRDVRDPHFLIFQDKLFVYTGTWHCKHRYANSEDRDINLHLGYGVWSTDGGKWSDPQMLDGTFGHYIWRAAAYNGKAYLCGRRLREFAIVPRSDESRKFTQSVMLESEDGLIWKKAAFFQELHGDETAFLFEKGGSVVAIARQDTNAQLCRSKPPYKEWNRKGLGRYIGGPLIVKWNGRYLVGGRKMVDGVKTTVFYWLINDQLHECIELPSEGDNSYPGFVELSDTRALISYYSSHEKDENGEPITAIYLAELEILE